MIERLPQRELIRDLSQDLVRSVGGGTPSLPVALLTSHIDTWEMDETIYPPRSRNNNWNLDARIGIGTFQVAGVVGTAYDTAGAGYSLERLASVGVDAGPFTIGCWFKDSSSIMDANERGMLQLQNITSGYRNGIWCQNGNLYMTRDGIGGGVSATGVNCGTFAANSSKVDFYHYCMTFDGTTLTAYVNGSPVGSREPTGTPTGWPGAVTAFHVNYRQGWAGPDFSNTKSLDGIYDQVAIWSRALNSAEVAALYNGGSGLAYASWTA